MPLFRHCPFDHSATQKLEWAKERCWTTHLWYDIGIDNDDLRTAGVGYEERMDKLGGRYMLAKTQIETAVAKYEASMDALREEGR
ncbi:hypothetical protein [Rhizobium yanglingense]